MERDNDTAGGMMMPPTPLKNGDEKIEYLTKREHFAALAMQGIMANRLSMELGNYSEKDIAELAIEQADELLKQLDK